MGQHVGLLCTLISVSLVSILLVLIIASSHTDHHYGCNKVPDHKHLPHYRPVDGYGYGTTTKSPMKRMMHDNYDWDYAPDPAHISDMFDEKHNYGDSPIKHPPVSCMLVWFGQFIDHMIVRTDQDPHQPMYTGDGVLPSHRTESIIDSYGVRQQMNKLTPYMDGSALYGSSEDDAWKLRKRDGTGRMRYSIGNYTGYHDNEMLPFNDTTGHYFAGDVRAEEHIVLTAMHTLWLREHNYWADRLRKDYPDWDGDKIYHTTRHIVVGEIQSIAYREWLPILVGSNDLYGRKPCYTGHSTSLSMINEFATAAYRFGHAMVPEHIEYRLPLTKEIEHTVTLSDAFFEHKPVPKGHLWRYGIAGYLLGAVYQKAPDRGPHMVSSLRRHLFKHDVNGTLDLASINIARGRDHGLPSYQQLYAYVTNVQMSSCHQLTQSIELCAKLHEVYGNAYDKIDPWVGMICERSRGYSVLGTIASDIVSDQFASIRDNDPYFYLWDEISFNWRAEIHNTRFSKIILRNTDINPRWLPPDVFRMK